MGDGDDAHESDRTDDLPHPRDTVDLLGHAAAQRAMLDAFRSGRLAHAWLVGGPRGIGKATLAWRFARFLLAHPDPSAPDVRAATDLGVPETHPVWARLRGRAHGDLAVLRREWNDKGKRFYDEIRVDDVRKALGLFQRSAGAGGFRICIIDSADDLNRSSANALLKVVEEPPPRSLFLIVAHQPARMLPTIVSRCRKLTLGPLDGDALRRAVRAARDGGPDPDARALEAVVGRSGGSVGRALQLLDAARLILDGDLRAELDRLPALDWRALHRVADRIAAADRTGPSDVLADTVLDWLDGRAREAVLAGMPAGRLAPLAEVWDKVRAAVREAEALNLDKRPLLLSIFADLAGAVRLAGLDGAVGRTGSPGHP